jgi:hypothetical protein
MRYFEVIEPQQVAWSTQRGDRHRGHEGRQREREDGGESLHEEEKEHRKWSFCSVKDTNNLFFASK